MVASIVVNYPVLRNVVFPRMVGAISSTENDFTLKFEFKGINNVFSSFICVESRNQNIDLIHSEFKKSVEDIK